jgi:hypothetical protein
MTIGLTDAALNGPVRWAAVPGGMSTAAVIVVIAMGAITNIDVEC